MLKQKRVWIPIVSVLVIAMGCGLFYGQKVANQEPVKVYKPVDVSKPATPKPPPPGETAESGHWKPGDEWHAQPHDTDTPADVSEPPSAETAQMQVSPPSPLDFSSAYQALREKYPEQTNNPPAFENVPVDLWDFQATKTAFMDHFNFYMEQGGNKPEVFENNREVRIAFAVMEGIHNAARPWVGLFTPEQREEIDAMHRERRKFEGYISPIDKIMEERGVTREVAIRISTYEKLKSKGWTDEEIPAHYREVAK